MIHFGFELPQRPGWQGPRLKRFTFSPSLYRGRNFTMVNGLVPVKTHSTAGEILHRVSPRIPLSGVVHSLKQCCRQSAAISLTTVLIIAVK